MPRLTEDPMKTPLVIAGGKPMSVNKTGNWRSARPVIHEEKCTGCMICWKFCPEACVTIEGELPKIHLDWCKGCAVCVTECPVDAVTLVNEEGQ